MGSSTSHHHHHHHHMGGSSSSSSTSRHPKVNRTKQRLASLICGASTSQKEDCGAESLVNSSDYYQQKANRSLSPTSDSIPTSSTDTRFNSYSSPTSGIIASSESSSMSSEIVSIQNDSHVEPSNKRKCFLEGDETVCHGINAERKCYQQRRIDSVNPSSAGQLQDASLSSNRYAPCETHDLISDMPHTSPTVSSPNGLQHEEQEQPTCFEEFSEIGGQSSESGPSLVFPDPDIASRSHGDGVTQEAVPSGLELFVPERAEAQPDGSSHHVDVVSISNLLPNTNNEISTREARRNSRRMFLDAFSSRSSRRHAEFPAILFTTEGSDVMGSHRRWLLDIGDDFFDDEMGVEPWRFGRRSHLMSDRRRSSRSEFRDRLRSVTTESSHRTSCPLDLHPDGSCTCELDEEATALSSISRIILLAEALFEVLDEIHRQPESFSSSTLSVPAPESIVDSLPIRIYEKPSTVNDGDVDQCHICLVEYEKGDKIRVLPCHHSYHMLCVDKWLKEIHGVCPLCRRDVQEGAKEVTVSRSDASLS